MNNELIKYSMILGPILLLFCFVIIMTIIEQKKELEEQTQKKFIHSRSKLRTRFFELCYGIGKSRGFQKLNNFGDKVGRQIDKIGKVPTLYCFLMILAMLRFIDPLTMQKYGSFLLIFIQPTNFVFIFAGLLVVKMISVIIGKSDPRSLVRDFAFGCCVMAISPLLLYFSNMLS